jgi:hypothetical protein
MDLKEMIQEQLAIEMTENGDIAYITSGSSCLDYFGLIGGMRHNLKDATKLMIRAYYEDPKTAFKLLLYTRDIYHGCGERRLFRMLYRMMSIINPEVTKHLIPFIKDYGRYDDLLSLMDTSLEEDVADYMKKQIEEDLKFKQEGKSISLLSKWMPSINTSNPEARYHARHLANMMNYDLRTYRKMLVHLRENIMIENHLRLKKSFTDYSKISEQALFKNASTLLENDQEGFTKFLENIQFKETKNIYPYQIVQRILTYPDLCEEERKLMQGLWEQYHMTEMDEYTLVVRDGSGSMYTDDLLPISVATSLSILFSERTKGAFKNTFLTFSEKPELITLEKGSIYDKIMATEGYGEVANTDIRKVYELILNIAKTSHIPQDQMIKRLLIISDMEFDQCMKGMSSYTYFKTEYEKSGYTLPTIVFWNVAARHIHVPIHQSDREHVVLVSGMNHRIVENMIKNEALNAYDLMMATLERYEVIDTLI